MTRAGDLLCQAVGDRAILWMRLPVVLGERSQPQSDLLGSKRVEVYRGPDQRVTGSD